MKKMSWIVGVVFLSHPIIRTFNSVFSRSCFLWKKKKNFSQLLITNVPQMDLIQFCVSIADSFVCTKSVFSSTHFTLDKCHKNLQIIYAKQGLFSWTQLWCSCRNWRSSQRSSQPYKTNWIFWHDYLIVMLKRRLLVFNNVDTWHEWCSFKMLFNIECPLLSGCANLIYLFA